MIKIQYVLTISLLLVTGSLYADQCSPSWIYGYCGVQREYNLCKQAGEEVLKKTGKCWTCVWIDRRNPEGGNCELSRLATSSEQIQSTTQVLELAKIENMYCSQKGIFAGK